MPYWNPGTDVPEFIQSNAHYVPKYTNEAVYSGADVQPYVVFNGYGDETGSSFRIISRFSFIEQISVSVHGDIGQARQLGSKFASEITEGPVTIAGTVVFVYSMKHPLLDLAKRYREFVVRKMFNSPTGQVAIPPFELPLHPHLPPFDLYLFFTNEHFKDTDKNMYNSLAIIRNLKIPDSAINLSVDDIITENVIQYVATDFLGPVDFEEMQAVSVTTIDDNHKKFIANKLFPPGTTPFNLPVDKQKDLQSLLSFVELENRP